MENRFLDLLDYNVVRGIIEILHTVTSTEVGVLDEELKIITRVTMDEKYENYKKEIEEELKIQVRSVPRGRMNFFRTKSGHYRCVVPVEFKGRIICSVYLNSEENIAVKEIQMIQKAAELITEILRMSIRKKSESVDDLAPKGDTAVWEYDFQTNEVTVSENYWKILKREPRAIGGIEDILKFAHMDEVENIKKKLSIFLKHKNEYCESHKFIDGNGKSIWLEITAEVERDENMERCKIKGTISNLLKHESFENKLRELVEVDALTQFLNKKCFLEELDKKISYESGKDGNNLGVFFIDLDNFKHINDGFGYVIGDEILRIIADRLKLKAPVDYVYGRFGGDEFVLALSNFKDEKELYIIGDEILRKIQEPMIIDGKEFYITVSIGIDIFDICTKNAEELLRNAETAMHFSKEKGKNICTFYSKSMTEHKFKKLTMEEELNKALKNNEFYLVYQPKIDIQGNRVQGCEALIRWKHPEKGNIYPSDFIPVAEESGFIKKIDYWVVVNSIETLKVWEKDGIDPLKISVNLSPLHFKDDNFIERIKRITSGNEKYLKYMEIEITENMLIESFDSTIEKLSELKTLGFKIALDDFGKGYSSLNYLKRLPIDILKIDKSFVDGICESEMDIIDLIISVGHRYNMMVVAEGVEQKSQYEYLKENKCDVIQGYYFSKPLESESIIKYIKEFRI